MSVRLVWPALLCVLGASSVASLLSFLAFAFFLLAAGGYTSTGEAIVTGLELLVPVFWLFAVSLLLLVDKARKLVWGILATISFGFGSIISVLVFAQILGGTSVGSFDQTIIIIAAAGPLFGLAGSVWALFWKLKPETVTAR